MPLAAVLFDMDGTLVDTEPYWIEAEYAIVSEFGGSWNDEHAHALVGNALITSAEYIRVHGPVPLEPIEIVERLLERVVAAAQRAMPWRPGAVALLAELRSHEIPLALVTMSYDSLAQTMIEQLPLGTFAAVVTGDQVLDGKPHPEAYLTAAARLGVEPADCVAIEDSPTGVASAEAAGCVVIAIPHAVPISAASTRTLHASLADLTVADLRALVAVVAGS
ncbi:HAD superfamily hydrolase (TIGR01509 family) [Jatrophihabitans sp. GAS493]|uniref:HAD family hydrolase n=1 Tax=Jatrophihabitans sp. GAS493 TaxID=1907575 RepID=UPI000BB6CB05|nr:HAD family phosphatase [Jatrophihabitans sp. GAS493]SOD73875.1 HAD superfamily hydrolase (TIGR01509 family) [Jatrophihabitans sp. GAS493]